MAIPEACGLWIEQRVQEELDAKGDTGASLREIGRKVAAEVERYFETKVKPGTITVKAHRMLNEGVTNVTPKSKPTENKQDTTPEIIKVRHLQGGGARPKIIKVRHPQGGGARPNAGRKPKHKPLQPLGKLRADGDMCSPDFKAAFDSMYRAITNEKQMKWKSTAQAEAVRLINILFDAATI